MPPRKALLDDSWTLKWLKYPLRSDFTAIRAAFQKLNHFPKARLLGRKDLLYRALCMAKKRWGQFASEGRWGESSPSPRDGGNQPKNREPFGEGLFPRSWTLPEEYEACLALLRDPASVGKLFIVKPAASACGRGVYLVKGAPNAAIPPPRNPRAVENTAEMRKANADAPSFSHFPSMSIPANPAIPPDRFLVQEYIEDPYLVYGYKFDLRLYVVLTSYEPVRIYLYKEGLVRFATSPYYDFPEDFAGPNLEVDLSKEDLPTATASKKRAGSSFRIADERRLTAHLTNFTINKKSEDFVIPRLRGEDSAANSPAGEEIMLSKWTFASLRVYMEEDGVDWEATMRRVEDLIAKVFLSIVPDVRAEMRELDPNPRGGGSHLQRAPSSPEPSARPGPDVLPEASSWSPPAIPPPAFTVKGVSPFFQIFGVDVLLQRGASPTTSQPDIFRSEDERRPPGGPQHTPRVVLNPVIMEVNIMPSLSTHYSPLDQCIKGNFIADSLNLVGLSPKALKSSFPTPFTLFGESRANQSAHPTNSSSTTHGSAADDISKQQNVEKEDNALPGALPSNMKTEGTRKSDAELHIFSDSSEKEGDEYSYNYLLNHFLRGQPPHVVEACMVSEEERLRSPHFRRLLPTSSSFFEYAPLLLAQKDDFMVVENEGGKKIMNFLLSSDLMTDTANTRITEDSASCVHPWRSLDEVLSAWEECREKLSKNNIKK
ncbi:unnamed protein product [Phytomonas sp. Hart1]|nr:unnamed protein product [Phytomonas sp. Hart1]|eukprot:CCW67184.1 unnamed protein product [Phytomonas sp. isolate Hart1]